MHFLLASFLDIPPGYLALLLGGVALIFAIRRWRSNVVKHNRQREEQAESGSANPLNVREVANAAQSREQLR